MSFFPFPLHTGGGYQCAGCGQWIPTGTSHACTPRWYTPPAPLFTVMPGVSEDRVREIIREELTRLAKPEPPTPEEAERVHEEIRRANEP